MAKFIAEAARAGVDGLLVLDLPPEESDNYEVLMHEAGLCVIYLIAPTTPDERIQLIVKRATGFIYYVSREGVTGMQTKVSDTIAGMTAKIRSHTTLPIAIGFGISNPEQARRIEQGSRDTRRRFCEDARRWHQNDRVRHAAGPVVCEGACWESIKRPSKNSLACRSRREEAQTFRAKKEGNDQSLLTSAPTLLTGC